MARLLHEHTEAEAAAKTLATRDIIDLAAAFDRAARGALLVRKLAELAATPVAPPREAARRRIIRAVEDSIQCHAPGETADALHGELLERLDGPELEQEQELGHRPVAEIIAEICRDLGLAALPGTHPWVRRPPDAIDRLCWRAAAPPGGTAQVAAGEPPLERRGPFP